jgi:hypothetical protein
MRKLIRAIINMLLVIDDVLCFFNPLIDNSIYNSSVAIRIKERLDFLTCLVLYLSVSILLFLYTVLCGQSTNFESFIGILFSIFLFLISPGLIVIGICIFLYVAVPLALVFHVIVRFLDESFKDTND